MKRRPLLALLALTAVVGCDSDRLSPETETSLSLNIRTEAGLTSAADVGVIRIEGPVNRTVNIQPGETRTIDGLPPGQYSVALEALLQGRLESFAETTVQVVAGRDRQANLTLRSFTPSFLTLPGQAAPGQPFTVQFGSVLGAQTYIVEWDDNASFSSSQSAQSGSTSAQVTLPSPGTYFVRVRARNRFGTDGIPTDAEQLTVGNEPPEASISQPADNATFQSGETVTFQGSAQDPEDGTLGGGALVWTSSIDDQIGTGTSFTTSSLSLGTHTITLTATDSHGASGTDSRTISVEAAGAPTVRIGSTAASTAQVGDLVPLPIILDLSQTGGLEVRELEIAIGFDIDLFGSESWTVRGASFTIPQNEIESFLEGSIRIVRIPSVRSSDFGSSVTVGTLSVDPAAVGTGFIGVAVVSASDPDGNAIGAGTFNEIGHDLSIEAASPDVQDLALHDPVSNLSGGVLYFRVSVPQGAAGVSGPVELEPVVPGGEGPRHARFGETIVATPSSVQTEVARTSGPASVEGSRAHDPTAVLDAPVRPRSAASAQQTARTLRIQMSGGSGDADMYVRFGDLPTTNTFDCRPFRNGNEESCDAVDPQGGDWFVMIRPFGAHNAYSGVTLEALLFAPVSVSTVEVPTGVVNVPYQVRMGADDGDGSYEWTVVSGAPPPGVDLAPDGTLSGTPGATGDYTFTVQVVSAAQADQTDLTMSVGSSAVPFGYYTLLDQGDPFEHRITNLAGGGLDTFKPGIGEYHMAFRGMGPGTLGSSFTAHVTTLASFPNPDLSAPDPTCTLSSLSAGSPVTAVVRCNDVVTGEPRDTRFRLLVLADNVLAGTGAPGQVGGFSAHDGGATPSYTPPAIFSWNSGGATQTVTYQGGGVVRHELGISVPVPFFQMVTAVGDAACHLFGGSTTRADVICLNRNGTTTDQRDHLVMHVQAGRPGTPFAYALIQGSAVNADFSRNDAGTIEVQPQGTGRWRVTFNGLAVDGSPAVDVTPVTSSWVYCSQFWSGNGPVTMDVACYDASGSFVDTGFFVTVLR